MRIQQSSSFLALLVLVFLFVGSNEVSAIRVEGKSKNLAPWKPITDLSDPHVQELGKYAIDEHNQLKKTNLKFDHLVSGETKVTQMIAGTIYKLVINASDGSVKKNYNAVIWEKVGGSRTLFEFYEA